MLDTLVPLEDYLAAHYRSDVDFVEGRIEERNAGGSPQQEIFSANKLI